MAGETDSQNSILEHQGSRLKDALKSCHKLVDNYRAMLLESSNDNVANGSPEDEANA